MPQPSIAGQPIKRQPDFDQFLKVLTRRGRPSHLPFYEHIASQGFISTRLGQDIRKAKGKDFWRLYADFWLSLGYDCVPLEIGLKYSGPLPNAVNPLGFQSEDGARISTMEDFETFPWPRETAPIDLIPFETVAASLPPGVKIVGGVGGGPYEAATLTLMGVIGLSYAMADRPELVKAVFSKLKALYVNANRILASMDCIGACRQGDDLGFKTSTFMPPPFLREHVFPIYKGMADAAHARNKPFILHSCGNLQEVYEDLIACGIDAKHSFEDQVLPVWEFQKQYGDRITPLGGLDVDTVCRSSEKELRAYTRRAVERCLEDGRHWALGTGNSLTDYMPVDHYLVVLAEAIRVTGG